MTRAKSDAVIRAVAYLRMMRVSRLWKYLGPNERQIMRNLFMPQVVTHKKRSSK